MIAFPKLQNPRDYYHAALCLLAFSVPVFRYGIQIPIAILVITWLFSKKSLDRLVVVPILLFSSIYLFHLIGMGYTENVDRGMKDLMQKLSLILFPVIIGTGQKVDSPSRKRMLRFFVLGTLTAVVTGFVSSAIKYGQTGDLSFFYMSHFSPSHHPSYISLYIVFSLVILFLEMEKNPSGRQRILLWACTGFLALSLVFPASKMGFINLVVVMGVFLIKWTAVKPRHLKLGASLLGLGLIFLMALKFDPVASARVEKAVEVSSRIDKPDQESQIESNTARIYSWSTSLMIMKDRPFGVGTGDINDEMVSAYRRQGLDALAAKGLNPHNEFLQIAVALGVPACLVFMLSLAYPLPQILRRRDWLYGIFLLSILIQFGVESMLEKQSGVIFFAFFNSLLFFSNGLSTEKTLAE